MALEKTLYIGPFIHCQDLTTLDICENGIIGVDETGKIAFIERSPEEDQARSRPAGWENAKTVKIRGTGFFFPGFIDTHIHAPQYPNAGLFGKSTLLDWLNTYTFPLESSFSSLPTARKIYSRIIARTLSHGTTTAAYYATIHVEATNLLADICLEKGQRAFVGRVCMDSALSPPHYRDESPESSYASTLACISHIHSLDPTSSLVTPIITPRFAPSCSMQSLTLLGSLAKETGVPIQTHLAENLPEIALVKDLFPTSKSYTDVYDSAGLLTPRTILAHCCHLSAPEIELIKERRAGIAHCPASNTALSSGFAPIRSLLNSGLTIGLGTDVSGGYTPSILAECREALFTSRNLCIAHGGTGITGAEGAVKREEDVKLSVEEALYLATRGGAKVMGLEGRIGGFEVGMEWDAQMVGLCDAVEKELGGEEGDEEEVGLVDLFGHESWEDRVNKWVYGGDDRNTVAVWVKGRLVHCRRGFRG